MVCIATVAYFAIFHVPPYSFDSSSVPAMLASVVIGCSATSPGFKTSHLTPKVGTYLLQPSSHQGRSLAPQMNRCFVHSQQLRVVAVSFSPIVLLSPSVNSYPYWVDRLGFELFMSTLEYLIPGALSHSFHCEDLTHSFELKLFGFKLNFNRTVKLTRAIQAAHPLLECFKNSFALC